MSRVNCAEHGDRDATMVCVHIVSTLKDSVPRGFLWGDEGDAGFQAICTACNEMPFEEWDRDRVKNAAVICFECFQLAAAMNGVQINMTSQGRTKH